jgi:hypothetical protein
VLAIFLAVSLNGAAHSAACDSVAIGVDPSRGDSAAASYTCRGYGQVFTATDTLIHSISVWRRAYPPLDGAPRLLYITEVDQPTGTPDVSQLLLSAPPLSNEVGDGIHPVEYRWIFDPPFALPHRGEFFFDIMAGEFFSWGNLAASGDPYPDGQGWETSPTFTCDRPGPPRYPGTDLCFQVQFCRGATVGAEPRSWGKLKITYR